MKKKEKTPTEKDILKYEIARELGLWDKIEEYGWKSLTSRESGKLGGEIAKHNKKSKTTEKQ